MRNKQILASFLHVLSSPLPLPFILLFFLSFLLSFCLDFLSLILAFLLLLARSLTLAVDLDLHVCVCVCVRVCVRVCVSLSLARSLLLLLSNCLSLSLCLSFSLFLFHLLFFRLVLSGSFPLCRSHLLEGYSNQCPKSAEKDLIRKRFDVLLNIGWDVVLRCCLFMSDILGETAGKVNFYSLAIQWFDWPYPAVWPTMMHSTQS